MRLSARVLLVWLLTSALLVCLQTVTAGSPPVKVQLRAPWSTSVSPGGSPLLVELLEAAHSQQPSSFWPLVSHLVQAETREQLRSASDQETLRIVQDIVEANHLFGASSADSEQALDAWKLSLALHDTSPRIQAFSQLYQTLGLDAKWQARSDASSDCLSWVDWNDQVLCSVQDLQSALDSITSQAAANDTAVRTLSFDHVVSSHTGAKTTKKTAFVLYADLYSSNFAELHRLLHSTTSTAPTAITYILRWRPTASAQAQTSATYLAGYGAILDLKKVDYLVIDDRKLKDSSQVGDLDTASADQSQPQLGQDDFQWLQDEMGSNSNASMASLSAEQVRDLGIKAAELITTSSDPLRALQELSQNFPLHAASLAYSDKYEGAAAEDLIEAVLSMGERRIEPGGSDLWINGLSSPHADFHPLKLLQTIRKERREVQTLSHPLLSKGLNPAQTLDLISSSVIGRSYANLGPAQATFDASDRIEKRESSIGAITWLNDLENDAETMMWSKDLMDLLRPMWPGNFPRLSLNLFNVVFVMDLSKRESCRFLGETVANSLGRVGLRWGVVAGGLQQGSDTDSAKMARLFWFLIEHTNPHVALDVLRRSAASVSGTSASIDVKIARKEAKMALKDMKDAAAQLDSIMLGGEDNSPQEKSARAYASRLRAFDRDNIEGHVFINGQYKPYQPQIVNLLHQTVQEQIQQLAPQIYYGQINSRQEGLDTYFYDAVGTLSFRSMLVPDATMQSTSVSHSSVDLFSVLTDTRVPTDDARKLFHFFYPRDTITSEVRLNSTVWVIADLDSQDGASLLLKAAEALASDGATFRLGVIHTPWSNEQSTDAGTPLSAIIYKVLTDMKEETGHSSDLLQARSIHDTLSQTDLSASKRFWSSIGTHVASELELAPNTAAILVDGHLVSSIDVAQIEARDISAVVQFESAQKLPSIIHALKAIGVVDLDSMAPRARQDVIFAAVSVLNTVYDVAQASPGQNKRVVQRTSLPETIGEPIHTVEIGDRAKATVRLVVLLDPLSESAQRWSSVLRVLSSMKGVYIRIILNPQVRIRELPLKRFYRYSAPKELKFDVNGRQVGEELRFDHLPEDAVLTLGLEAPASWLTMPEEAVYDLDNIRLSDVPSATRSKGVKAIYELKHILIEGHAREIGGPIGAIPRGAQLLLETPDASTSLDTIVMANLAYFQFKAQPGLWKLGLRPGKSDEVYEMVSVGSQGWNSPSIDITGNEVILDTLSGLTIYPKFGKRKGKEKEELLDELDARGQPIPSHHDTGVSGYASSLLSSAKSRVARLTHSSAVARSPHADINIFTVASGHLYERMTYIMILSVLKHTSSTVKFWFIENFLSPSFKEFIPHLAEEYGFKYELVTYAWPHWLRSQKEKQRTIWGYKILFLDTLFPLDLTKVIFVDADQVVRTDLKELVDVDLEGKVYGYPPMGDDSYDMDGFRFWKQGYWKDFLAGRPYHISALYVVDLVQFRRFAAGDKLRGQYQALSADPHSLSNLDQDLPNNMQAILPIHTLEKEWLWCETWCSSDWLAKAKTIDLCSNPKTKEPKLQRARRQIPEWTALDQEVAALAQRLVDQNKVGTSVIPPGQVEQQSTDATHHHDEL